MTHSSAALLPDSKTFTHLFGCENREWQGILVKVTPRKVRQIAKDLTDILERFGYGPAEIEDQWVFAKGTYSPDAVKEIENYLSHSKHIAGRPVMSSGPYFSFIGYDWVEKYKKSID